MGEAIGGVIGYAIGIAVSPVPIAAVILMMFSARARVNSVSFMLAWVIGIATVVTVVLLIPGLESDDSTPSDTTGWIKLAIGALLVLFALSQWRSRPGPDDEPPVPKWMQTIDGLKPGGAFGLGFLLSAVNPKNLLLAAAGGVTIGSVALTTGEAAAVLLVFTAIAAATVVVPVVAYLVAGSRLDPSLDAAKDWLIGNNAAVMAVLFLVFGVSLIGDGIEILSD